MADEVGQDKVVARLDDGSIELVLGVSSFASIQSWVLGLLDHATIVEPLGFREDMVAWLGALIERPPPPTAGVPAPEAGVEEPPAEPRAAPDAKPAVASDVCWPWSGGWRRWARRPSPRRHAGSA